MTIVRWQPIREITSLQREMERLFSEFSDRDEDRTVTAFVPAAELKTDAQNIYLQLEVPGLTPEEIDIQASINSVAITGERKEEQNTQEDGIKRSEFRYGKFHRVINLPEKVRPDGVQAKYEHGLLKLTFPKVAEEKPKTIKVEVAA